MSDYKKIKGVYLTYTGQNESEIKASLENTSDTTHLFYTLDNKLVAAFVGLLPTWTTVNNMNVSRSNLAGAGTNTAALAFGGFNCDPGVDTTGNVSCTESYNGTSWTTGGAMVTARYSLAGAGTNTAALAFGGRTTCISCCVTCTESYNGSSWTTGGAMATARRGLAGAGTNTSALAFGGICGFQFDPFVAETVAFCTESYNGTSWTAGGSLNVARNGLAGAGTNTAALAFGNSGCTESYNGTSWTTGGAMVTARSALAGAGTNTAALGFGGYVFFGVACTESYNGTSWTTVGSMNMGRFSLAGDGASNTSALAFGGTEEGRIYNQTTNTESFCIIGINNKLN